MHEKPLHPPPRRATVCVCNLQYMREDEFLRPSGTAMPRPERHSTAMRTASTHAAGAAEAPALRARLWCPMSMLRGRLLRAAGENFHHTVRWSPGSVANTPRLPTQVIGGGGRRMSVVSHRHATTHGRDRASAHRRMGKHVETVPPNASLGDDGGERHNRRQAQEQRKERERARRVCTEAPWEAATGGIRHLTGCEREKRGCPQTEESVAPVRVAEEARSSPPPEIATRNRRCDQISLRGTPSAAAYTRAMYREQHNHPRTLSACALKRSSDGLWPAASIHLA